MFSSSFPAQIYRLPSAFFLPNNKLSIFTPKYTSMKNKHLNTNKQFMIGNGLLAFAVLIVVAIFVYMSLRFSHRSSTNEKYDGIYEITLLEGFIHTPTEIHLNDSVIFKQEVETEPFSFSIQQFDPEGALLFVNRQTDDLAIFNLSSKGGKYAFKQKQGKVQLVKE